MRKTRVDLQQRWYRQCQTDRIPFISYRVCGKNAKVQWDLLPAGIDRLTEDERKLLVKAIIPFFKVGQVIECGVWSKNIVLSECLGAFMDAATQAFETILCGRREMPEGVRAAVVTVKRQATLFDEEETSDEYGDG